MLLVELDGDQRVLEHQLLDAAATCEGAGAVEILVATDEARRRQIWDMRRNVNPVLKELHRFKFSEDVVVPRAAIPEMIRRLDTLAADERVTIATFGHAGDGNLHVNVLFDDEAVQARLESILTRIVKHALDLGGTLSGEHGIGLSKRRFMGLEQPEPVLALQRRIKRVFDPLGLMNPGKLLPEEH